MRYCSPKGQGKHANTTWTVYSLSGCPYCKMAKKLLEKNGQKVNYIEAAHDKELSDKLAKDSGITSWPKIYRGLDYKTGSFFGGYQKLEEHFGK